MGYLFDQLLRYAEHIGTQEWALILVLVIVIGVVSLRGFGSRSGY